MTSANVVVALLSVLKELEAGGEAGKETETYEGVCVTSTSGKNDCRDPELGFAGASRSWMRSFTVPALAAESASDKRRTEYCPGPHSVSFSATSNVMA